MRLRRYLTWTLAGATMLSLLLHFFTIFGETIFGLVEAQLEPQAAIRKTERKLAEQSMDEDPASAEAGKHKAKPLIDKVTVYLVPAAQLRHNVTTPKPAAPRLAAAKPKPKSRLKPKPPVQPKPEQTPPPEAATQVAAAALPAPVDVPKDAPPPPATPPEPDKPKADAVPPTPAKLGNKGSYRPGEAKTGFPKHIRVKMLAAGVAEGYMEWRRDKNTYHIEAEGGLLGKRYRITSDGDITPQGLRPKEYKSFSGDLTQPDNMCLFNWDAGTVQVGKRNEIKTEPLDEHAQDLLSFVFQFAAFGSKIKDFDIQICRGTTIANQVLTIAGEASVAIAGRDVTALVIKGENDKGRAEAWLAPDFHNVPVKMFVDSTKRKMSGWLVATELEIDGKAVLAPQKPVNQELYPGAS